MANDFLHDYESLQLAKDASWNEAQTSYRKLVHRWHPDRYAQRPRELAHAQKQFIELTKCFNNLRNFYRKNDRLPFERNRVSAAKPSVPKKQQRVESVNGLEPDLKILNNGKNKNNNSLFAKLKPLVWTALAGVLIIGSLAVLFVMDKQTRQRNIEQARDVLKDTKPSEFLPKTDRIKKQNNRGAIMNNTAQGRLGDQLMQDVFR
ncbi:MAG: DnaJ domain-containing protein [Granulosicoccaceae bacterium]